MSLWMRFSAYSDTRSCSTPTMEATAPSVAAIAAVSTSRSAYANAVACRHYTPIEYSVNLHEFPSACKL